MRGLDSGGVSVLNVECTVLHIWEVALKQVVTEFDPILCIREPFLT